MAKLEIFIGYMGLIPQYHIIETPYASIDIISKPSIKPLSLKVSKEIKHYNKVQKFFVVKARNILMLPQKRSTNYEGTGLNKRT